MYKTAPKEVIECRPYGIKFAEEIGQLANRKFGKLGAQRAALIGSLALQTILVSIAVDVHPPGSEAGEKFLMDMFEALKQDLTERWHAEDLKVWFGKKQAGH